MYSFLIGAHIALTFYLRQYAYFMFALGWNLSIGCDLATCNNVSMLQYFNVSSMTIDTIMWLNSNELNGLIQVIIVQFDYQLTECCMTKNIVKFLLDLHLWCWTMVNIAIGFAVVGHNGMHLYLTSDKHRKQIFHSFPFRINNISTGMIVCWIGFVAVT